MRHIDLTGQRFGRLVAMTVVLGQGPVQWSCQCDCGKMVIVLSKNLRKGRTQSCGCYQRECSVENNTVHGHTSRHQVSTEYAIYCSMLQRCTNPKREAFKYYGGRGITVCQSWQDSFTNFIKDMGLRPKNCQIDRIDNNGGYHKDNCRWVPIIVNANNKRNCVYLTYNGETLTVSQWAVRMDIPHNTIRHRLKAGWAINKALTVKQMSASEFCKLARAAKRANQTRRAQ